MRIIDNYEFGKFESKELLMRCTAGTAVNPGVNLIRCHVQSYNLGSIIIQYEI